MSVHVVKRGTSTTVQGGPLYGRAHMGFSIGGAADFRSLAIANRCIGNPANARGLESVLAGPALRVRVDVDVCVAGAPNVVTIDNDIASMWTRLSVRAGQTIRLGTCTAGLRNAIAFTGGIDAVLAGTTLAVGDELPLALLGSTTFAPAPFVLPPFDEVTTLRVTDGAQGFAAGLLDATFTIAPDSDRCGVRLAGAVVAGGGEIVTEGANVGAVQVPPSGEPIILGVDRTSTGGYAKLATVISVDVWRLGQLRPGARVRFEHVSFAEARRLIVSGA